MSQIITPPWFGGLGGRAGEALIVVGAEAGEHGIGVRDGGGASETKFADQAVLAGAPDALDATVVPKISQETLAEMIGTTRSVLRIPRGHALRRTDVAPGLEVSLRNIL
jgi:hypothetical protein